MFLEFKDLIKDCNINKGDTVLLVSDITNLIILYKKRGKYFNVNSFIDSILETIGEKGTLLIPTYNWDFLKGITYDYYKTPSMTGSISKIALKRDDFKRTTNPIYSFAVFGKDKKFYCNLQNSSCFSEDSPYYYLYKNNAKYFSINLDYKNLGFAHVHFVEEIVGVSYRYFKYFSGDYIDQNNMKKKVTYKYYVRDPAKVVRTGIRNETDDLLMNIKAYSKYYINNEFFSVIELKKALDLMIEDMKNNPEDKRLVYPIRKGAIGRSKINQFNWSD